jgi:hypothetical protein
VSNTRFTSFSAMVSDAYTRQCITYRVHGQHGELRKPVRHRFAVKGGISTMEAMRDTMSMRNPLLERLSKR